MFDYGRVVLILGHVDSLFERYYIIANNVQVELLSVIFKDIMLMNEAFLGRQIVFVSKLSVLVHELTLTFAEVTGKFLIRI